jgi:flagellar biosynthesis/type III secretory pathway M-ring protein FliF/YscJ
VAVLIAILALVLLVVVILVVSAPLRAARSSPEAGTAEEAVAGAEEGRGESPREHAESDPDGVGPAQERAELEAAREAKYREIRDTELDYRTGKLSQEDFAATDGALRAEAVEILDRLAALEGEEPDTSR